MMNPEKSPLVFINYKYRTVFFVISVAPSLVLLGQ